MHACTTHTHIQACTDTHVRTHRYMHRYMHAHTHTHTTHMYTCAYTLTDTCTQPCTHTHTLKKERKQSTFKRKREAWNQTARLCRRPSLTQRSTHRTVATSQLETIADSKKEQAQFLSLLRIFISSLPSPLHPSAPIVSPPSKPNPQLQKHSEG